MKPEKLQSAKLKQLAEALYQETVFFGSDKRLYIAPSQGEWFVSVETDEGGKAYAGGCFDPTNNVCQREEILLFLLGKGWEAFTDDGQYFFQLRDWENNARIKLTVHDKDYTTALLAAAERELENE